MEEVMPQTYENKFIFEIVKSHYGFDNQEILSQLIKKCDIEELTRKINFQGINGFIFEQLNNDYMKEILPLEYQEYLRRAVNRIAIENKFIEVNAVDIFNKLKNKDINIIWFKGNVNINRLYDSNSIRQTSDIDFLVDKTQRKLAVEILKNEGFRYPQETMDSRKVQLNQEDLAEVFSEMHYSKETEAMILNMDLHLDLTGFYQNSLAKQIYNLDKKNWFEDMNHMDINGHSINVLSFEDEFVHMIFHYSVHHSFCGIKWLIDICQVIKNFNHQLDWEYINTQYNHPNEQKMMGICFRFVNELTALEDFGGQPWQYYWKTKNGKLEYRIYKSFCLERIKSFKLKIGGRLIRILMPATMRDKWKMFKFYFLSGESIQHRVNQNSKFTAKIFQPFKLLGILITDITKKR